VFLATTLFGVTSLWMAILADTGATVLVTANALRLLRFRTSPLSTNNSIAEKAHVGGAASRPK
jgi:Cd2+/Zn2+-exporting ATPase